MSYERLALPNRQPKAVETRSAFVGYQKDKVWIWTVVNHHKKDILLWNIGDRSSESFKPIWQIIKCWHSFRYVTDGWKVYPMYIEPEDHLVCKTYMTRVQRRVATPRVGENTRLRHCARGAHRRCFHKTLYYSKSTLLLKYSIRLLLHYLRFDTAQFSI